MEAMVTTFDGSALKIKKWALQRESEMTIRRTSSRFSERPPA
jgi:hypothetical protein